MFPPRGSSPAERWVTKGIQAAGLDLILRLIELDFDHNIYVLAAEQEDRLSAEKLGAIGVPSSGQL